MSSGSCNYWSYNGSRKRRYLRSPMNFEWTFISPRRSIIRVQIIVSWIMHNVDPINMRNLSCGTRNSRTQVLLSYAGTSTQSNPYLTRHLLCSPSTTEGHPKSVCDIRGDLRGSALLILRIRCIWYVHVNVNQVYMSSSQCIKSLSNIGNQQFHRSWTRGYSQTFNFNSYQTP